MKKTSTQKKSISLNKLLFSFLGILFLFSIILSTANRHDNIRRTNLSHSQADDYHLLFTTPLTNLSSHFQITQKLLPPSQINLSIPAIHNELLNHLNLLFKEHTIVVQTHTITSDLSNADFTTQQQTTLFKTLIFGGSIIVLLIVLIVIYLFSSQAKKYNQLLGSQQIIQDIRQDRSKLKEKILFQLKNPPVQLGKNTREFLNYTCRCLTSGLNCQYAMIFCPSNNNKDIKCIATSPLEIINGDSFSQQTPIQSKWPTAYCDNKISKTFINQHFDLSNYPDSLVYNIEYSKDLFALLVLDKPPESNFYAEDKLFINNICNLLALHFETKQKLKVERQLFKQFYFDSSTHLPNSRSLLYHMNSVLEAYACGGVLLFEVSNLLSVNNVYGIQKGDEVLLQISDRLQKIIDSQNFAARLSQNKFTVLSYGSDTEEIRDRLKELFAQLNEPFALGEQKVTVPLNGGVALFPDNSRDTTELVEFATKALQVAGIKTPGKYLFYDNITIEDLDRKQALTIALYNALNNNEVAIHYQPYISTEDFSLEGVEALMRWRPAQFETLSPEEYIPLAEETGIIKELGLYVLEQACIQHTEWQKRFNRQFTLAVNVSPKQLLDEKFADNVLEVIQRTGIAPEMLELEITEMIASQENSIIDQNVNILIQNKVGFAIDDFGSGYASFHYVKRFTSKKIKIDRKFTENIEASNREANLVKMIVTMGHSLDAQVTAEGVSTLEQFSMLKDIGCDFAQGFFISRPLSPKELEQFLIQPVVK